MRVIDEGDFDAHFREGVMQQVVGTAVERWRSHDVVTRFDDGKDRKCFRSLA